MTFDVVYAEEASDDIDKAFTWRATRAPAAAIDLLQTISRAEIHLARNPLIYTVVRRTRAGIVRRTNLRSLRYQLYYLIDGETVTVIARLHASRSPRAHLRVVGDRARRKD